MHAALDVEKIRELIQSRDLAPLAAKVRSLPVPAVVAVLDSLTIDDAAVVFRMLGKDQSVEVFDDLDSGTQADLISELGHSEIADVFAALDPEEQAWLLDEVPAAVARRLVSSLDRAEIEAAMNLLGYAPGSAGRRMSPEVIHTSPAETVGELLARVRGHEDGMDMLCTIPVLERDRTLVGQVDLLELMRHSDDTEVGTVMVSEPEFARTDDDGEQVARHALDEGILLLPVVDREDRLVGILPIADAARIDRDAVAEDQARAGGTEPLRRSYLLTPIRQVARARIVWLLVLAISAVLTVQVLDLFEATLAQQVALALFIPLLIGIGGNTGSQAATTVTRALALGEIEIRDGWKVAFKEIRTGLLLGGLLACLAFLIASLFYGTDIGAVIALTLIFNCPIAATVGGVVPLVARACKVDPAVFSTPFIATFCDASGLLVYFSVAILVLGL
ncbi:magnesium transporter [Sediminivirga luteola]|uniref:Magnesium transporter MgtE n=1 Tax=Sediminivirga luteola TaxID=1774748 RepID=A0A8J2XLN9_9MICO|nr:magnesium transporter [Sediminivirga luteola]GGA24485.1 magnesium transporter MgtE [Sediminivirga luteola]